MSHDFSLCIEDVQTLKEARDALKSGEFKTDSELSSKLEMLLDSILEDVE